MRPTLTRVGAGRAVCAVELRDVSRNQGIAAERQLLLFRSAASSTRFTTFGAPLQHAAFLKRQGQVYAGFATCTPADATAELDEGTLRVSRIRIDRDAQRSQLPPPTAIPAKVLIPNMRTTFTSATTVINWFPGHMAKGLRVISENAGQVDLFIEVRDARIPLASINTRFEAAIGMRDRIILYNKADLADKGLQKQIKASLSNHKNTKVLFGSLKRQGDNVVRHILHYAAAKAMSDPVLYPHFTMMVVGMPNVGKSSLINALRGLGTGREPALRVAPVPGVTKAMHYHVKVLETPPIFVVDTPGVMVPYIADPLGSLKVALTGGIHDSLLDLEIVADYLLYLMNVRNNISYVERYDLPRPTDCVHELLSGIAKRRGKLIKGGVYNLHAAADIFVREYRKGQFGAFTVDDVSEEAMAKYFTHILRTNPSEAPEFDEEGHRLISKTAISKRKKRLLLSKAMKRPNRRE